MRRNVPSTAHVRMWKIPRSEPAATEAPPPAKTEIPRGYSLADIDHAARVGLSRSYGWRAGDIEERFAAARHAVIDLLYTAEQRPPFHDLARAAQLADHEHVTAEMREHGIQRTERGGGNAPNFERYWWAASANIPSPEGHIVERLALGQIMPLLTKAQQDALTALATHETYQDAAHALGLNVSALTERIAKGRRTFAAAWHEHETPRRELRRDRRVWSVAGTDPVGRKRVTVSQLEQIRARKNAGELVREMAAELGVTPQALHALLRGARKAAPDPVGAQ